MKNPGFLLISLMIAASTLRSIITGSAGNYSNSLRRESDPAIFWSIVLVGIFISIIFGIKSFV